MKQASYSARVLLAALASLMFCTTRVSVVARADTLPDQVLNFFAGQGCVIGPTTRQAATDAGFDADAVDAFAEALERKGEISRQGKWRVLSRETCTIRIPEVMSEIRLTDPEVVGLLSAPDAYAAEGSPGCFLSGAELYDRVQQTRAWDADKANLDYVRFLAASLRSGELAFYSESPLATPMGFVATTGACAAIPLMPAIKRNHTVLLEHFDALVRASGEELICETGARVSINRLREVANALSGGKSTNAWIGYEVSVIAMGAGWYEGMSATGPGMLRPPLCHYQ